MRGISGHGRSKRACIVGALAALLTIALAACGGGGGSDAAVSIKTLRLAAENTQAAESSRFTMDVQFDVAGHDPVTMHGEGVTTGDGKSGLVTMEIPSAGTIEERIVDGALYMKLGDLVPLSKLHGKQWVKVNADALGSGEVGSTGLAAQAGADGPRQGLEYLQGLSGDVTKVGDDTVAGQHATHYKAQIDYAKVADELPESKADQRGKIAKLGIVPADVWIDDHDRVVKMQFAIDGNSIGEDAEGKVELTLEITDFGVPVDVQAPPADEVIDFSSLGSQKI
jgi:hypothetical protein